MLFKTFTFFNIFISQALRNISSGEGYWEDISCEVYWPSVSFYTPLFTRFSPRFAPAPSGGGAWGSPGGAGAPPRGRRRERPLGLTRPGPSPHGKAAGGACRRSARLGVGVGKFFTERVAKRLDRLPRGGFDLPTVRVFQRLVDVVLSVWWNSQRCRFMSKRETEESFEHYSNKGRGHGVSRIVGVCSPFFIHITLFLPPLADICGKYRFPKWPNLCPPLICTAPFFFPLL